MFVLESPETQIAPQPGESYAQFVQRAHYALKASIPDWEERNQAVWDAWEDSRGDVLRERAQQYFPSDKYRFVPNVCYFSEHQTIGRDGNPVKYTFKELSDISEEQNFRCDRHNYSAIASRHTSDEPSRVNEPEVLGYTGSTRLGMVGNDRPEWAIFVDEYHRNEAVPELDRKQRRSVEINRFRDGRRPYFDPIAALGSESPRLPLPIAKYSGIGDIGKLVERYSVMALGEVSGTSSFIPNLDREKYEEPSAMGLTEQDISAVVRAIQSTPEMQWVRQQMGVGSAVPSPSPSSSPSPPQHGSPQMPQQPQPPRYSKADSDVELTERYSVLEQQHSDLVDKYNGLVEVNSRMTEEYGQMRKAVVQLEQRAVDAERTDQIRDLYQKHQHFVDFDEELERCLYSRGSEMSDEEFSKHLQQVEKYALRSSPVTSMLPGGGGGQASLTDKEQYAAALNDAVVERYTAMAARGEFKTYAEIEAIVKQEMLAR